MRLAFDLLNHPLDGVQLIEASAGTGKTWTLCALYLRLLLEKKLDVGRILVVTFTRAAAAELRERIRARIHDLAHAIAHIENSEDPLARRWLADGAPQCQQAQLRLERALYHFDQAAITPFMAFASARFWMHRLPARIRRNLRFRKTMKRCGLNARGHSGARRSIRRRPA